MYLSIVPAYGRDYRSAKAVRADWEAGKDFMDACSGRYLNKDDAPKGATLNVRYARLTKVCVIKVGA